MLRGVSPGFPEEFPMRSHLPRRSTSPVKSFVPRVESLEGRCLPACHVSESAGVLLIQGTNRANAIQITDDGGVSPGSVQVTCGGVTTNSVAAIGQIRVLAHGGKDVVTYSLTGNLAPRLHRGLHVDLGDGRDTFQAFLGAGVQPRGNLNLEADGGTGIDTIRINAAGVNIDPGATLRVFLVGGEDADRVSLTYQGKVAGQFLFRAEGNGGTDRLTGDVTLLAGSTGLAKTEVR